MPNLKKNTIALILLVVISIIICFVLSKNFPPLPVVSDSEDYHNIAQNIITQNKYITISKEEILYPPLYPIFLSVAYSLGLGISGVYVIQYLIVAIISICVFYILRKYTTANIILATIASFAVSMWPYFILYSQLISSEVLYSLLLILFFLLFIKIEENSSTILAASTGIVLGLAIITRPVALLLLPWFFIVLFFLKKTTSIMEGKTIPWKKFFIVFLFMLATIAPWEIYVKKTYDRFIPISSNLSYVFKKANETKAYLSKESVEQKDVSFIQAKLKNIYLFWDPGASGYHLDILKKAYPKASYAVVLYKVIFFLILGLAIYGGWRNIKNKLILYSTITILYFWALHTALFPFPRYTLPIIPFAIIVAVVGATTLYGTIRKNKQNNDRRPCPQ